ncbi:MAG TPA: NAD(+) synthase, partial [Flavobacterium sp.]|nr:NAD(+) synthase [Flavobacterium sp.]
MIQAEEVKMHIVDWLRNYAMDAKANGFVVGISGGIDSAVTSALCALTGLHTLCVEMPIHQAQSHVSRAREHIQELKKRFQNISSAETDLTAVFETFKSLVPAGSDETKYNLSLANARARLRMAALYYHGSMNGLLVAGTGNKVEDFGVGFYTKYGDGGVDISPIADLMKSEVYELARHLDISSSILAAAPTDGLFGDDRSDEDQLGASYDELEWAMEQVENEKNEKGFSGRELEVVKIYRRLNTLNKHKMIPIPICKIPE